MEAFMNSHLPSSMQCHARGHASESGEQTWWDGAAAGGVRTIHPCIVLEWWYHPFMASLIPLWMKVQVAQVAKVHGETFWKKPMLTIQVFFQNIDGLSQSDDQEIELHMLHQFTYQHKINIVGMVETNTCWDLLHYEQRLLHKTQGWWEMVHWSLGFNQMDTFRDIYQPRGTCVLAINTIAHWYNLPAWTHPAWDTGVG